MAVIWRLLCRLIIATAVRCINLPLKDLSIGIVCSLCAIESRDSGISACSEMLDSDVERDRSKAAVGGGKTGNHCSFDGGRSRLVYHAPLTCHWLLGLAEHIYI
jgi:hypothetical protein